MMHRHGLGGSKLVVAAALAALPMAASTARAQYRLDTSHANDANNRLNSGGYNSSHDWLQPAGGNNTQILTGNVTGLGYFHGNSQVFDPNQLQVNTETQASDQLNAIAAPVNYGQRSTGQSVFEPYYSTATVTQPPPPGSAVITPNNTAYIPAPQITQQAADTRLGAVSLNPEAYMPQPGQAASPVYTPANADLTISPLYGDRGIELNDSTDMYGLSRFNNGLTQQPQAGAAMDSNTLMQMRDELNSTAQTGQQVNPSGAASSAAQMQGVARADQNLAASQQLNNALPSANLNASASISTALPSQSIGASLDTQQGLQQRLTLQLPPPGQQSSQIAALEQRERQLQAQAQQPMSDQQASVIYNQQLALRRQLAEATKQQSAAGVSTPPQSYTPPSTPGVPALPPAPPPPSNPQPSAAADQNSVAAPITPKPAEKPMAPMLQPNTARQQPMVITSLATGVHSPSLANMLKSAEDQMRQGKFNEALDTYDTAAQVAPNNPMISLGRGFAELGASYYGRAERDIRRSIDAEPALLQGRYDLKGMLGEDRLTFVSRDLQDIYKSEKSSEQAAFLLAFLAHNDGQDEQAVDYLNAAEQRSGGKADATINRMRQEWGLPLNK